MSTNNLKVYWGCYDGKNRYVVAAKTKKKAYECMSNLSHFGSYTTWNKSTMISGNIKDIENCMPHENVVFRVDNPYTNNRSYVKVWPKDER
jgi:hypothetical protein